jgi:predicted ATP-binding protein involved in virulence
MRVSDPTNGPMAQAMARLCIQDFAHLCDVDIDFGHLTLLVGAQASGKSLSLQWLKAALDGKHVARSLEDAGHSIGDDASLLARRGRGDGAARVLYVPAHRAMLISDGWAQPFQRLGPDTPVVARLFSQRLFELFRPSQKGEPFFPRDRVLKKEYRDLIDGAVFHGGRIELREDEARARRLRLLHGGMELPFMTWTSGQREFTPLLLGLYSVLPNRKQAKDAEVEWIVIEEPEMGLHPEAISVVLLLCLELLHRGYRVVVSTHSPLVVSAVWMLRRLREEEAGPALVCSAFGVNCSPALKRVAASALDEKKRLATYLMRIEEDGRVVSKDISSLDPGSEDDDESGWGGLSGFGSRFADTVRQAVLAGGR